ncbi:hypothetical protein C8R44DRAFT_864729 [Mycena epipterygia]|nr:hypothetical protein C8R44DRAFT_864729 [Mycena epipterygia]
MDHFKELETVLFHTAVSNYAIGHSLCLYFYDFILAFPDEVEYFWGTPWTFVSLGKLLGLFHRWSALEGPKLRVHALYGRNRTLKIIVSLLFVIALSTELSLAVAKLATDRVIIQAIPFLIDPLSLCVETIPNFLVFYPVPVMTFDTILLVLVYKTYLIQHEETSAIMSRNTWTGSCLIRIIFRDSVVTFACTVGVNLFNVLMWALGPYDLFTVGTAWPSDGGILFNMRKEYRRPTVGRLDVSGSAISTQFQVARRQEGSKGPTVWSSSSESTTVADIC